MEELWVGIITFASEHNWDFLNRVQLRGEDFEELLNEKGQVKRLDEIYFDEQTEKAFRALQKKSKLLRNVTVGNQFALWIKKDCTILSFDTGNGIGSTSHVVIRNDKTEMAVYYDGSR